jgi:hypothetical protein|nr:MAG TPA: HNH endonuclease [Myoviridae sp. ctTS62]
MDYQKIYDNLIKKRIENPPTEKFERHHIVPRSLGGSDDKENIVKLTLREHYIAHLLLCMIHRGTRNYFPMLRALSMMKAGRDGTCIKNSRMFEYFRTDFSKMMCEAQSGEGNSQYGKSWYYHPELNINKLFHYDDEIPDGFVKGRKIEGRPLHEGERRVRFGRSSAIVKYDKRTCIYCGEEFEARRRRKCDWCTKCKSTHYKLNPNLKVEGRDYLTDEQHIELFHEFLESGLTVRQFASQCRYNISLWHLYERWRKLGLNYRNQ